MHLQLKSTGRECLGCESWEVLQRKEGGAVTIHEDDDDAGYTNNDTLPESGQ
jgi:hypothetical protein